MSTPIFFITTTTTTTLVVGLETLHRDTVCNHLPLAFGQEVSTVN